MVCLALAFALLNAGNNIAARMAMMAMTTSSSIKVNPRRGDVTTPGCLNDEGIPVTALVDLIVSELLFTLRGSYKTLPV